MNCCKLLYLVSAMALFTGLTKAQDYKYNPFPTKNAIWVEHYSSVSKSYAYCYGMKNNDTLINGLSYHIVYKSTDTIFQPSEAVFGIREDSLKRVYKIDFICNYTNPALCNHEKLMYDFNLSLGDTVFINNYPYVLTYIDTVKYENSYRKVLTFNNSPLTFWIEGIGSCTGLKDYNTWNTTLQCFKQESNIISVFGKTNCFDELTTGVGTIVREHNIKISPNPLSTTCTFEFPPNFNIQLLEIYDTQGRKRFCTKLTNLQ